MDPSELPTVLATLRTLALLFERRKWTHHAVTAEEAELWDTVVCRQTKLSEPTPAMRAWVHAIYERHGVLCLCQRANAERPDIVVALPRERKLDIHTVRCYVPVMKRNGVREVIFVHAAVATPQAAQLACASGLKVTRFLYEDLAYFAPESDSVAHSRRLPKKEAEALMQRYGRKLPVMLSTDLLAMLDGYRKGDVIEQIRVYQDAAASKHYYRVQ